VPGVAAVGAWPVNDKGGHWRRCPLAVVIDATAAPWRWLHDRGPDWIGRCGVRWLCLADPVDGGCQKCAAIHARPYVSLVFACVSFSRWGGVNFRRAEGKGSFLTGFLMR
jgi:hypothetical protein